MNDINIIEYIKNSISKDKIREKLKWLRENTYLYSGIERVELKPKEWYEVEGIIIVLNQLLEEGNSNDR